MLAGKPRSEGAQLCVPSLQLLTSVDSTSCVQMSVKQGRDVLANLAGMLSGAHRCSNAAQPLQTKEAKPVVGVVAVWLYVNMLDAAQKSVRERCLLQKDLGCLFARPWPPPQPSPQKLPKGREFIRENDLIRENGGWILLLLLFLLPGYLSSTWLSFFFRLFKPRNQGVLLQASMASLAAVVHFVLQRWWCKWLSRCCASITSLIQMGELATKQTWLWAVTLPPFCVQRVSLISLCIAVAHVAAQEEQSTDCRWLQANRLLRPHPSQLCLV